MAVELKFACYDCTFNASYFDRNVPQSQCIQHRIPYKIIFMQLLKVLGKSQYFYASFKEKQNWKNTV